MSKPLPPFPDVSQEDASASITAPNEQAKPRPIPRTRKLLISSVAVAALLIGTAAAAAYWRSARHKPAAEHQSPLSSANQQLPPSPAPQPAAATSAGQYTSNGTDLNLSFAYPSDWTVSPPSGGNSADKTITVSSPPFNTSNSAGKEVTGKVFVTIRPGSAQINELSSASVVAQDSVQIAYAKPAADQHQYPYLTFVRLGGGTDPNDGFDEVIITGISKFMKGQNLSPESLGQLDPVISAKFVACSGSCTNTASSALLITAATWQNDPVFMHVLALLQSLQLH